jgi:hypothetical protein
LAEITADGELYWLPCSENFAACVCLLSLLFEYLTAKTAITAPGRASERHGKIETAVGLEEPFPASQFLVHFEGFAGQRCRYSMRLADGARWTHSASSKEAA